MTLKERSKDGVSFYIHSGVSLKLKRAGSPALHSAEKQNHTSSTEGTEAKWWAVQFSDWENRFYAVLWFRAEAEPYSILTALGPEELKIALINSAVVMLQQSDLRETCSSNTGERLITSCYIKCCASTETNNAVQQRNAFSFSPEPVCWVCL